MRSAAFIVLILCGTLLFAGPTLMEHFRDADDLGLSNAGRMSFWFAGMLMILGGMIGAMIAAWRNPRLVK